MLKTMSHISINRPFVSYVLTQSMLVMIVLAASQLIATLAYSGMGLALDRFWISVCLVVLVQLPAALIFARAEDRKIDKIEGWAVSLAFVGVTLAVEVALQEMLQQATQSGFGAVGADQTPPFVILFSGIAALLLCLIAKAVSMQAEPDGQSRVSTGLTSNRPAVSRDYSELYRRELIGANIAIFGLSLTVFGPQFLHLLKLSIPLSFVFSLVCVANRMAREERKAALSTRCLSVAMQLLPLTVVSMGLLAMGTLYENYVAAHNGAMDMIGYFTWMVTGLGLTLADLAKMVVYTGVLFAICLSANTLMLVLFARLIRPLVNKTVRSTRESYAPTAKRMKGVLSAPTEVKITMARDLRDRVLKTRTPRPNRVFID